MEPSRPCAAGVPSLPSVLPRPPDETGAVPAEVRDAVGHLASVARRHGLPDALVLTLLAEALAPAAPATRLER